MPERGLDWFSVVTEAFGDGTPDLGYFPEVSVYIGGVGVRAKQRGATRCPRGRGAPSRGAPPPSWAARGSSRPPPALRGLLLVQKYSPFVFRSIGLRLIFLFCETLKQEKTETGTRLWVNRLVPKLIYKCIIKPIKHPRRII